MNRPACNSFARLTDGPRCSTFVEHNGFRILPDCFREVSAGSLGSDVSESSRFVSARRCCKSLMFLVVEHKGMCCGPRPPRCSRPLALTPSSLRIVQSEAMLAAQQETCVFPLTALCLLSENSHQGHQLPTAALHRGFAPVNSCTATGFAASLYDEGRRSRSTGKERDAETGLDYFGARYFSGAQGRFMSADPLGSSAKVSNPQTWNRYTYGLNNPLRFVDPDGLDVPDSCAKDNSCQIVVKVNVIYDQTVNNGKGLTSQQRQQFESAQLSKAQKDFQNSNIQLQFSYTLGSYTEQTAGHPIVAGLSKDALNIVVSTTTPNLKSSVSGLLDGLPTSFVNFNEVTNGNYALFGSNSTEHELGHQFLGDPFGGRSSPNEFLQYLQNTGRDYQIDTRNTLQQAGQIQSGYRIGLEPRRYAVPADPNAAKPKQQ